MKEGVNLVEAKNIKKVKEAEYGVAILNKPRQMINMDLSGLSKFQHDIMDALLHNLQQKCKETADGLYMVNILDIIKYVSDSKDGVNLMKQNSRIKESIDMLTSLKLISEDKYRLSNMVIFPRIEYNKLNGDILYRMSVEIEEAFKNGSNLILDKSMPIPKELASSYYTRIYLDTYDDETRRKGKHSLETKSIFQFICKNEYIFRTKNINTITITLEEMRALCGCNYSVKTIIIKSKDEFNNDIEVEEQIIDYENKDEKYPQYKDFKRCVLNKIVKEMNSIYNIPVEFHEIKFGKIVKKIDIVVDKECEAYKELSRKMQDDVDNVPKSKDKKIKKDIEVKKENIIEEVEAIEISNTKEDSVVEYSTQQSPYSLYKPLESNRFFGILKIKEEDMKNLLNSKTYNSYKFTFSEFDIDKCFMVTEELFNLGYVLKLEDERKALFDIEHGKLRNLLKEKDRGEDLAKALLNTTNYEGYVKHMLKYGLNFVPEDEFNDGYRVKDMI